MNAHPRLPTIALVAVVLMTSCSRSPSYLNLIGRDEAFYSRVASACEDARTNTPATIADNRKISPEGLALPAVLRDLHPDYLRITTNRVFLSFGVGRGAYNVVWEQAGGSSWKLTTYAEDLERILFTRKRL
ncbi:MAG TPA: hypothetical protein VNZ64_23660 [Candidatus Acidoferrum sp.]|jgi:hypothetical protein|nr:hypothetical protein [Candidatus Acidoferrum sp.]